MQKYKVFLNEKCIRFSSGGNITLSKPLAESIENSEGRLAEWLQTFAESTELETVLEHDKPKLLFEKFKSALLCVPAAGGIVIRDQKILFIFRNGKWDLPKGKIDKGELAAEAAVREIEEECGIKGHEIIKTLPSTYHIYISPYKKSKGKWIFKETFWYEMTYEGEIDGSPQLEEGITKVCWFKKDELDEVYANTYASLKPIIDLYRY